jgi:REP element-mobilizing transposase RayT
VPHLRRPTLSRHHPVHVTLRVEAGIGNLRRRRVRKALYRAFAAGCDRFRFRLVHFSVQRNHLHLLCEAHDQRALGKGMQGLSIRVAKAINRSLARRGSVFSDRYHARALTTPREVRHALAYVLNHAQRHGCWHSPLDPCSSATLFQGWRRGTLIDTAPLDELSTDLGSPVAAARTWLLGVGWRRHGLLDPDEVPGPGPKTRTTLPSLSHSQRAATPRAGSQRQDPRGKRMQSARCRTGRTDRAGRARLTPRRKRL